MRTGPVLLSLALLFAATGAAPLHAQAIDLGRSRHGPPRGRQVGIQLLAVQPQGDFEANVSDGYGAGVNVVWPVDRDGALALRMDVGVIQYGRERRRLCLAEIGCRITLDLNTDNDILVAGIGPQLMMPRGRVRLYANGGVGVSYFFTQSSLEGSGESDSFANTTNFDDAAFSWNAGGGVYLTVHEGRHPISVDLGAHYRRTGEVSYLKEGSIQDNPDGSISFTPIRTPTAMATYSLGIAVGF